MEICLRRFSCFDPKPRGGGFCYVCPQLATLRGFSAQIREVDISSVFRKTCSLRMVLKSV